MKKILLISQHYPPEIGAASNRVDHIVRHLIANGYLVYLITSHPSYPEPTLYRGIKVNDQHPQLRVYRSPIISALNGKKARMVNQIILFCYALLISFFLCLSHSIKTCLTTSPPFLVNLVGLSLRIGLKRRWIMEVRDLWPDSMVAVGAINRDHLLYKWLKRLELLFYCLSSYVVVVTEESKRLLVHQGINEEKVFVITNGIPDWIRRYNNKHNRVKAESNVGQKFNVVYVGNIGLSQNLGQIIYLAEQLRDEQQIQFYFIGEGLEKKKLEQEVEQRKLENVTFVNATTDKDELIKWYLKADLGLVCLRQSPLFSTVIPSKIFEYGGMQVPILFIGHGEASLIIQKYGLGQSVEYDTMTIKQAILNMKSKGKADQNAIGYQAFMHDFSWDELIRKYISILWKVEDSDRIHKGVDK